LQLNSEPAVKLASRVFVLDLAEVRMLSVRPDGCDKKIVTTGGRLPDGFAVDVEAGHIYWKKHGLAQPRGAIAVRSSL
jgi:hypothetical protein